MLRLITNKQLRQESKSARDLLKLKARLLPVAKGIYTENPSIIENGCSNARSAFLINEFLTENKEKIAKYRVPSLILCTESAIHNGFVGHELFALSSFPKKIIVNDLLFDAVSPAVAKLIDTYTLDIKKSNSAVSGVGVEEFIINDELFKRTIPERTLIDVLVKYYHNKEIAINTDEVIQLAKSVDITFDEHFNDSLINFLSRMGKAAKGANSIGVTQPSVSKAFSMLATIKESMDSINKSNLLKSSTHNANKKANPSANTLFFYGEPIASFERDIDKGWQFDTQNSWFSPLLSYNNQQGILPALIKNVIRESELQNVNSEMQELTKQSFLGNLQTAPVGELPNRVVDTLDLSLSVLQDSEEFNGDLIGFPSYKDNMFKSVFDFIRARNLPAISGCQVKVPAHFYTSKKTFTLSPCEQNDPFTHILKIAPNGKFETASTLEWFGLTLAKAAHVDVPPFALVDYSKVKQEYTLTDNDAEEDYFSDTDVELGGGLDFGVSLFDTPIAVEKEKVPPALVIERFDLSSKTESVKKIGIEMATILGLYPQSKYKGTMEQVAEALKKISSDWQRDSVELYRNLLANYLVCNGDYHLKNISILAEFNGGDISTPKIRLSPAYDIVCTAGFGDGSGVSALLCLPVAGNHVPTKRQLIDFAEKSCDISASKADEMLINVAQSIIDKMADILSDIPKCIENQSIQTDALKIGHDRIINRIKELGVSVRNDYYTRLLTHQNKQKRSQPGG